MTAIAVDPRPQPEADIWSPPIDGVGAVSGRLLTKLWHHYNEKRGYFEMVILELSKMTPLENRRKKISGVPAIIALSLSREVGTKYMCRYCSSF